MPEGSDKTTQTSNKNAKQERGAGGAQKDVSLGPACLVFAVIGAVALSLTMIGMAAMLSSNQGRRAAYSVREMIIPWVEQSSLTVTDRNNIVERLTDLASDMEREELTSRQLSRLVLRMSDSPVLQWGVVEQLAALARKSEGFPADEKTGFIAACDRALRSAAEGRLSIQDMEFAVQNVAVKDQRSSRLSVRDDVDDDRLREFQRRISTISDKLSIPKEPFEKSVSQVFLQIIEDALKEKK
jgi:predicted DNA-binding protein